RRTLARPRSPSVTVATPPPPPPDPPPLSATCPFRLSIVIGHQWTESRAAAIRRPWRLDTKSWYKIGLDAGVAGGVQYEYQASHYRRKQNEHQHRRRPEDQAPARHGWLVRLLFPQQHVRHPQGRPRNVDPPPPGRPPRARHRRDLDRRQPRRGPRAHRLADLTAPRAGPRPRPVPQGAARSGLTIL